MTPSGGSIAPALEIAAGADPRVHAIGDGDEVGLALLLAHARPDVIELLPPAARQAQPRPLRDAFVLMVPVEGIEPPLLAEHDFESCASTSSATRASTYL